MSKSHYTLLGPLLLVASSASAEKPDPNPVRMCAAPFGPELDAQFTDTNNAKTDASRSKGKIAVYRYSEPESLDWGLSDTYLFSVTTGQRLMFTRTIIYSGHPFTYVQMTDRTGKLMDNRAALPNWAYIPDEVILKTLRDFCRLKPKK